MIDYKQEIVKLLDKIEREDFMSFIYRLVKNLVCEKGEVSR